LFQKSSLVFLRIHKIALGVIFVPIKLLNSFGVNAALFENIFVLKYWYNIKLYLFFNFDKSNIEVWKKFQLSKSAHQQNK
jgi:hypothetical protein